MKSIGAILVYLATIAFAVLLASCGTPVTPPNITLGPNVSTVTFDITDSCNSAPTVDVKFFDKTTGGIYPSPTTFYIQNQGDDHRYALQGNMDSQVCFGACISTNANVYWGVGIDGTQGCQGCCSTFGKNDPTPVSLTCPNGVPSVVESRPLTPSDEKPTEH
jgi:hypothetical protein